MCYFSSPLFCVLLLILINREQTKNRELKNGLAKTGQRKKQKLFPIFQNPMEKMIKNREQLQQPKIQSPPQISQVPNPFSNSTLVVPSNFNVLWLINIFKQVLINYVSFTWQYIAYGMAYEIVDPIQYLSSGKDAIFELLYNFSQSPDEDVIEI